MLSLSFLLVIFSLSTIAATAANEGQTESIKNLPPAEKTRSRNIDIKNISLDLRFDRQIKQAYGSAAITFSTLTKSNKITLDAGMLTINFIKLDNGDLLQFNYDSGDKNDGLKIMLDRTYTKEEIITVKIDYHTNRVNETDANNLSGSNGKGIRFLGPTSAEPKKRIQIWSMGEPESNRYWFPCYDSPDDMRTTEFKATIENNLSFISNGILIDKKDNTDGTHTFHFKTDKPYSNHLTSFAAGEYTDVIQNYDGITLHNYCYPDELEATKASVERLPDMVKFFSEITGVKYPHSEYSQVFVQDLPWGNAGSTISIQTENMIDDFGTHADFFYLWDGLQGESLAQQWFGNYLSCSDWNHIWLTKAFGRYFSGLYNEYKNGREEFLLYQHSFDQSTYHSDRSSGIIQPVVNNNNETAFEFAGGNYPYFHGASVLQMLRKELGEENWSKSIKLYISSNAGKNVTTKDFVNAVEEASGESMKWFFDQWVYKTGHPVFKITKKYDSEKKILTLYVKQIQKTEAIDLNTVTDFFRGKVEIEIDGNIRQVMIEAKAENIFTFDSQKEPKLVNFDFESTWIKEITFEKTFEELLYQLLNDKDILGRLSAMTELVNIAKNEKTSQKDKLKTYKALRKIITGDSYWRLRFNAVWQLQSLLAPSTQDNPASLDKETTEMLLEIIKNDSSWVKTNAIRFLGMTCNPEYSDIYINAFNDKSDRVVNAAAIALGKSKSPEAFDALVKLKDKPSWKNQSLISSLNGLKELNDPRGFEVAYNALSDLNLSRWMLSTPVWDFRIAAAETIVSLGKGNEAFPMIFERFKNSLNDNDLNVIFNNVLLITTLSDPRGTEVFEILKVQFKDDENTMTAVYQYESQFKEAISRN